MILLDSNIVIEAANARDDSLRSLVEREAPFLSAVSLVEVLGYHRLDDGDRVALERFYDAAIILVLSDDVIDRAVLLRQARRMSLGDALIAATALIHDIPLMTRNVADFRRIDGLSVLEPPA